MISSKGSTARKLSVFALLAVIVATQTFVSAGFLIAPSTTAPSRPQHTGHPRRYTNSHRGFGHGNQQSKFGLHEKNDPASTTAAIRGGDGGDDDDVELRDCCAQVAGMFGNLRIPASLIAGASLGSAFALPMLESDGFKVGFAKRVYAFSMITTLGSMLLVVMISTIVMNDIFLCPKRFSKSVGDYVNENYALEWMLVKSNFYYGALAFVVGSGFRAWISIACPVVGRGVIGILASLTLICKAYLIEKTKGHTPGETSIRKMVVRFVKEIGAKAKANPLFGAGAITWLATVTYLTIKFPHIYFYLSKMDY